MDCEKPIHWTVCIKSDVLLTKKIGYDQSGKYSPETYNLNYVSMLSPLKSLFLTTAIYVKAGDFCWLDQCEAGTIYSIIVAGHSMEYSMKWTF